MDDGMTHFGTHLLLSPATHSVVDECRPSLPYLQNSTTQQLNEGKLNAQNGGIHKNGLVTFNL